LRKTFTPMLRDQSYLLPLNGFRLTLERKNIFPSHYIVITQLHVFQRLLFKWIIFLSFNVNHQDLSSVFVSSQ